MEYQQVLPAVFIERPNRFVALCMLEGHPVPAHVKNTGRCRELLTPGRRCFCLSLIHISSGIFVFLYPFGYPLALQKFLLVEKFFKSFMKLGFITLKKRPDTRHPVPVNA